jgi:decaprenylphospho-beta-D-erythro-pentofuranosid-2-ulose 2-reductase
VSQVLIIGATSAIAQSVARQYAERGAELFLVARDAERLDSIADDLRVRGAASTEVLVADLSDHVRHPEIIAAVFDVLSNLDIVVIAHGVLPDQDECQQNVEQALYSLDVNFLSVVSLLTPLANRMEENKHGAIAVITSVAGDRGRQSNYVYGAAKAGLDAWLQGLRNRLFKSGVHVVTIKPGFVDTPMTAHITERGALWAQPDDIATGIVRALDKQQDVVYLPRFWRLIMLIIRSIPERIFKRLSL